MSTTLPQIVQSPSPALTDLEAGRVVTDDGTNTKLCSVTNQAATQQVFISGVTIGGCAAGDLPSVAFLGGELRFVASGTVAVGDLLVAKYSATASVDSTVMTVTSHAVGDQIVGICTLAATDGGGGKMRLICHQLKFA